MGGRSDCFGLSVADHQHRRHQYQRYRHHHFLLLHHRHHHPDHGREAFTTNWNEMMINRSCRPHLPASRGAVVSATAFCLAPRSPAGTGGAAKHLDEVATPGCHGTIRCKFRERALATLDLTAQWLGPAGVLLLVCLTCYPKHSKVISIYPVRCRVSSWSLIACVSGSRQALTW